MKNCTLKACSGCTTFKVTQGHLKVIRNGRMRYIVHHYLSRRRGVVVSVVRRMNEVTLRRARLVPGWVTDFGRVYHHGT